MSIDFPRVIPTEKSYENTSYTASGYNSPTSQTIFKLIIVHISAHVNSLDYFLFFVWNILLQCTQSEELFCVLCLLSKQQKPVVY